MGPSTVSSRTAPPHAGGDRRSSRNVARDLRAWAHSPADMDAGLGLTETLSSDTDPGDLRSHRRRRKPGSRFAIRVRPARQLPGSSAMTSRSRSNRCGPLPAPGRPGRAHCRIRGDAHRAARRPPRRVGAQAPRFIPRVMVCPARDAGIPSRRVLAPLAAVCALPTVSSRGTEQFRIHRFDGVPSRCISCRSERSTQRVARAVRRRERAGAGNVGRQSVTGRAQDRTVD